MSDDIPFDKTPVPAGRLETVAPGVRRLVAPNPGPFTFTGSCTYVVGTGEVAVIDPGPDDPAHVETLLEALRGESVSHIFLSHTHRDHSGAVEYIKAATGAPVLAEGPHRPARKLHLGEVNPLDAAADTAFEPDIYLSDGAVTAGAGWSIEAIFTPGHTANHMVFALREANLIFSGDHVMAWATSIVAPPDGAMSDYIASLQKLTGRSESVFLPGHGPAVRQAPAFLGSYIRHRLGREASILHRLSKGETDIATLVRAIYIGLDPRLAGAASLSVLAHLEDLVARGIVASDSVPSIDGRYRLA